MHRRRGCKGFRVQESLWRTLNPKPETGSGVEGLGFTVLKLRAP